MKKKDEQKEKRVKTGEMMMKILADLTNLNNSNA